MRTITSNPKFTITDSEKKTAVLLLQDLTVKEIADLRYLSFSAVQSQAVQIRKKMNATTMYTAIGRMIVNKIIPDEDLVFCLPEHWKDRHI